MKRNCYKLAAAVRQGCSALPAAQLLIGVAADVASSTALADNLRPARRHKPAPKLAYIAFATAIGKNLD